MNTTTTHHIERSVDAGRAGLTVWMMAATNLALCVAAVVLPITVPNPENGLAAAGTAAVLFLLCAGAALIVAFTMFIYTCVRRARLSVAARIVGWSLLPLELLAITTLIAFAMYTGSQ